MNYLIALERWRQFLIELQETSRVPTPHVDAARDQVERELFARLP